jgi:hypothetical protein
MKQLSACVISILSGSAFILCSGLMFSGEYWLGAVSMFLYLILLLSMFCPSRLAWYNWVFVQWFFIRICTFHEGDSEEATGVGFMFPVVPISGWWFSFIPKKRFTIKVIDVVS